MTVPFVVYGLFRYLLLLHRRGLGEEPDALLVEDLPLLVTVAAWATTCAIVPRSGLSEPRLGSRLSYAASAAAEAGSVASSRSARNGTTAPWIARFELPEPLVDAAPARRDEIDEDREVVDPRVALREELLLEPLEAA